jgi:hypothetical protein
MRILSQSLIQSGKIIFSQMITFSDFCAYYMVTFKKKKLRGFGPLANYTDRPSDRRFLAK